MTAFPRAFQGWACTLARSATALPGRSEEAVGTVTMRPQAQHAVLDQRRRIGDTGLTQQFGHRQWLELGAMCARKGFGHGLVFGVEQAACRVDESPSRFDQPARAAEYRGLR